MTDYQAANDAAGRENERRTRLIAQGLGKGWTAKGRGDSSHYWTTIDGPDGAELSLNWGSHERGRLGVYGQLPKSPRGHGPGKIEPTRITVALSKSEGAIAADIARRVLPEYLSNVAKVNAHNAETLGKFARAAEIEAQLSRELPNGRTKESAREHGNTDGYGVWSMEAPDVDAEVSIYSEEVTLKVRTTPTIAVAVCRMLRTLTGTGATTTDLEDAGTEELEAAARRA